MYYNEKTFFSQGIPERKERHNGGEIFIYPEELIGKTCGACVRCEPRDDHAKGRGKTDGWHCCMRDWDIDISPDHKACVSYWDKEEELRVERLKSQDQENRRKELWAIYAKKPPVKLPIVNDGYGRIPMCPVCGEMPYSTSQCHWCGQRFVQDETVTRYNEPDTIKCKCKNCGEPGLIFVSKYNGHKSFSCHRCGTSWME